MEQKYRSMRGDGYVASHLNTDHDIAGPIEVVITTPATGIAWRLAVGCCAKAECKVTLTEDVTIDAAGTALALRNLNRQGTHPDSSGVLAKQGGTYTGGTEIFTAVAVDREELGPYWILKPGTSYLITATSLADNNYTSVAAYVWQG